jgi:HSP20 family protein
MLSAGQRAGGGMMSRWSPPIEVSEQDGQMVVCADLPGINKDDVRVEVTDDALVIAGERKHESDEMRGGVRQSERSYGSFQRIIPLPEGVKADEAKARFKDGVLEVRIPVQEQKSRARRIQIDSAEGGRGGEPNAGAAGTGAGERGQTRESR